MKHGVTKMKNTKILILTLSALSLGLSGCANVPPDAGQNPEDPYEAFNRNMHAFNVMVDDAALKPVTKGYRWVTPQFVQDGVSNAIDNLGEVNNTLNNVLQGKVDQGITSAFRFMLNSTIGVFGLFDVATWVGMERAPEDFGQTLGVWGVPEPVFRAAASRSLGRTRHLQVARADRHQSHHLSDVGRVGVEHGVCGRRRVDTRSRMMDAGLDDMRANVVDEYVAIRDVYRQSRRMAVADGQIDEDAQLNSLTPLSFDDEEAEDDAASRLKRTRKSNHAETYFGSRRRLRPRACGHARPCGRGRRSL